MKVFLILLALGLAASEKLDRTYLPPPGAKFSGGSPGAIQTPLELPKESTGTLVTDNGLPTLGDSLIELGISRGQPEFGQVITTKAPLTYYTENLPITTTSYAFTQTTTLPPLETYGTTLRPINLTTGLPVQYASQNPETLRSSSVPQNNPDVQGFVQGQRPSVQPILINGQPGTGQIGDYEQPNYSEGTQLLGQYQDQYPIMVIPGGNIQNGLVSQLPNQQGFQYPDGQNVGQVFTLSVTSQGSANYQPESLNSNFESNASPISPVNSPAIYPEYMTQPGFVQPSIGQSQYQQGGSLQFPINQDFRPRDLKDYQPGSSSAAEYFNQPGYSSTTPQPSVSSTAIPTFGSYVRPEISQENADKNAVIIDFKNIRTPNGYSYSYDTSNGIHAAESGIIDNGTKAKGGYSYIGDDGKVYSITYTADENGFQPRGDHLPTPPPIPEAIQKVIDQVARDKEAGISDDGSYDEAKYGDKKYQGKFYPYDSSNKYDDSLYIGGSKDVQRKPISGIKENASMEQNFAPRPVEFGNSKNINENSMKIVRIPPRDGSYPANEINQAKAIVINSAGHDSPSLNYDSPANTSSVHLLGHKDTEPKRSESQESYINPAKYSGSDINNKPEVIAYYDSQDDNGGESGKLNESGRVTSTALNNISVSPQAVSKDNQRSRIPQRPSNIRYTKVQNAAPEEAFVQKESYNVFNDRRPDPITGLNTGLPDSNKMSPNQQTGIVLDNYDANSGYTYNQPQVKLEQNGFPTRFRGQDSVMKSEAYRPNQGTILKPFTTPNVYNKEDGTQSLFARKPFEVILPTTENTFSDYSDDNDYSTKNQGVDTEAFRSTKVLEDKSGTTTRPYEFKHSTRPYQYTQVDQGKRVTQRVKPASKIQEYSVMSTTPMSSESRFGIAQSTQKPVIQYKSRPSTTNVVRGFPRNRPGTEVPFRSGLESQSKGPVIGYPATNLAPNSSPKSNTFGSRTPSTKGVPPQSFSTSTYKPLDYSGTTGRPEFDRSSLPVAPVYQTNYQYGSSEPISSYGTNVAASRPVPIPSGPGMYSQVAPDSTFQYGTNDYSQSPSGPARTGTGSPDSYFQNGISQVSPTATYQNGYKYYPGLSTTTGNISPGSSASDNVRTTPDAYSSSTYRPSLNEGYTQRPITVDNFGRPINSQVTNYPIYTSSKNTVSPSYSDSIRGQTPAANQDLRSRNDLASVDSTGTTNYPGHGATERIIGEDFSGAKQPQRFDPKTGYHY